MKFSVCNAVLRTIKIPAVFDLIAEAGFDGVEIAPRTIASSLDEIGASHIKACRQAAESAGLQAGSASRPTTTKPTSYRS
jgi:sugar phosphate isomerase/epimerase